MNDAEAKIARMGLWGGPLAALLLLVLPVPAGMTPEGHRLLAVTVLMCGWWLTQAIPIGATSLVPLVAFPLLGIQDPDAVSQTYIRKEVFLFLGGFIIALGIERWGLHQRLALHIVRLLGTSLRKVLLGFMLATAFLSMWISNTASTLLMAPIAVALVVSLQTALAVRTSATGGGAGGSSGGMARVGIQRNGPVGNFGMSLLLGICWSASIGGLTTLVGTVTNVQFVGLYEKSFPDAPELSAGAWLAAFAPVGLVLLLAAWGLLCQGLPKLDRSLVNREFFTTRLKALGPPSRAEWRMLLVFFATAALWTFRKPLQFGSAPLLPGWESAVTWFMVNVLAISPEFAARSMHDSTVAIAMTILMFLLPAGMDSDDGSVRRPRLMDWETAVQLPWSILLLVGGGFAVADGFGATGLAEWVGSVFAQTVEGWPVWLVMLAVCALMTFLTEFATNVVVVSVIVPVLAESAIELGFDPRLLMLPAAVSASCAFMLPIGTPPNAIVFATGALNMGDMAKRGFLLNLIGIVVMTVATVAYLAPSFGIQTEGLPDWARPAEAE